MVKWQWFDKRFLVKHLEVIVIGLAFFTVGFLIALISPHGWLNLWFSQHYDADTGKFFAYYTHLGQEWLLVPIAVLLLIQQKNATFLLRLTATFILNTLMTVVFKYLIFDYDRPKVVLEKFQLVFTEGVKLHSFNSFPSGHTSAAFAMAVAIALWFDKVSVSIFCFMLATGVGISRIYLQQHFLEDVLGGATIGVIAATLASSLHWHDRKNIQ